MIINSDNIKTFKDAETLRKFLQRKNKSFFVVFEKKPDKNGKTEMRYAHCDLKSRKKWIDLYGKWHFNKGKGQTTDKLKFLNAFDRKDRKYINISINRLETLKVGTSRFSAKMITEQKDLFNNTFDKSVLRLTPSP